MSRADHAVSLATPVLQKHADAPRQSATATTKAQQVISQAATTLYEIPKQVKAKSEISCTHNRSESHLPNQSPLSGLSSPLRVI